MTWLEVMTRLTRRGIPKAPPVSLVISIVAAALVAAGCAGIEPGRMSERAVIRRILDASVQIVLEREGARFRTGSGVVLGKRGDGAASECIVLTSGHAFAGVAPGDGTDISVLFDRHAGTGT